MLKISPFSTYASFLIPLSFLWKSKIFIKFLICHILLQILEALELLERLTDS